MNKSINKEIIITSKNNFVLCEYQDKDLGKNEIRGKTICSLISQGTELAWAKGDSFPIRPGYGAVFEVEEVGSEVTGINIGEKRFCMGAHRSTQTYKPEFTLVVPENLSSDIAVLARLSGVSLTTLMTTKARPGDIVFILGAGPVGILAAQNFMIGGFKVCVVEPDAIRRQQVASTGVFDTFATMPFDDIRYAEKVALVVDCSGHEQAVLDGCNIVRQSGEVVLVGVPWQKFTSLSAHDILHSVFFRFVNLRSGWEWELPITSRGFVWEELLEGYNNSSHSIFSGFEKALSWLNEDKFSIDGLIKKVSAHEDTLNLYNNIAQRKIKEPFIILDWMQ